MNSTPSPPALVIVRGNSGSGKSTVARAVQRALPQQRVAVIGQDHLRRDLLWERDPGQGDTIALTRAMARACLSLGRPTLIEGIFGSERYGEFFRSLLAEHPGPALVYYLDVSLPETLRRHAQRSFAAEVPDAEMASWYRVHDVLGHPGEVVLGESLDAAAMTARLLSDLAALDA